MPIYFLFIYFYFLFETLSVTTTFLIVCSVTKKAVIASFIPLASKEGRGLDLGSLFAAILQPKDPNLARGEKNRCEEVFYYI